LGAALVVGGAFRAQPRPAPLPMWLRTLSLVALGSALAVDAGDPGADITQ
jgi:hypothetical protein